MTLQHGSLGVAHRSLPPLADPKLTDSATSLQPSLSASGVYGVELPVQENGLVGEMGLAPEPAPPVHVAPGTVKPSAPGPTEAELAKGVLKTSAELRAAIGADPKQDLHLGPFRHAMSVNYKDVLTKLDAVHDALGRATSVAAHEGPQTTVMIGRELDDVLARLQELDASLSSYGEARRTSHKPEMAQLQAEVQQQIALLQGLKQSLASGQEWPADLSVQMATVYLRANPALSLQQMGAAAQGGLTEADVRVYAQVHIEINTDTLPGGATLNGELVPLGKGEMATVFKGDFTLADGQAMKGVFKAEPTQLEKVPDAMHLIGIDETQPQLSLRTVATSRLDQRLGFGLVPHTELHLHNGQLGTVSALAPGLSPQLQGNFKIPLNDLEVQYLKAHPEELDATRIAKGWKGLELQGNQLLVANTFISDPKNRSFDQPLETVVQIDMGNPQLRKELTRLQWLDALTGQVDRHAHNYFVHRSPEDGQLHVTAIDNDMAFGSKTLHANDIHGQFLNGAQLPGVIDRETRDALMQLTDDDLEQELGGLLSPAEVAAAKSRLADIQAHILSLDLADRVFDRDDQWTGPRADQLLGVPDTVQLKAQIDQELQQAVTNHKPAEAILMPSVHQAFDQAKLSGYVARETVQAFMATDFHFLPVIPMEQLQ